MQYYSDFQIKCDHMIKDIVTLEKQHKIKESKIMYLSYLYMKLNYYEGMIKFSLNTHSTTYDYYNETIKSILNHLSRLRDELFEKFNYIEE